MIKRDSNLYIYTTLAMIMTAGNSFSAEKGIDVRLLQSRITSEIRKFPTIKSNKELDTRTQAIANLIEAIRASGNPTTANNETVRVLFAFRSIPREQWLSRDSIQSKICYFSSTLPPSAHTQTLMQKLQRAYPDLNLLRDATEKKSSFLPECLLQSSIQRPYSDLQRAITDYLDDPSDISQQLTEYCQSPFYQPFIGNYLYNIVKKQPMHAKSIEHLLIQTKSKQDIFAANPDLEAALNKELQVSNIETMQATLNNIDIITLINQPHHTQKTLIAPFAYLQPITTQEEINAFIAWMNNIAQHIIRQIQTIVTHTTSIELLDLEAATSLDLYKSNTDKLLRTLVYGTNLFPNKEHKQRVEQEIKNINTTIATEAEKIYNQQHIILEEREAAEKNQAAAERAKLEAVKKALTDTDYSALLSTSDLDADAADDFLESILSNISMPDPIMMTFTFERVIKQIAATAVQQINNYAQEAEKDAQEREDHINRCVTNYTIIVTAIRSHLQLPKIRDQKTKDFIQEQIKQQKNNVSNAAQEAIKGVKEATAPLLPS